MEEPDQPREEETHPTKVSTTEPQEEFIAPKPQPSRPEQQEQNATAKDSGS